MNITKKTRNGVPGIPPGFEVYHRSNDASLFSCSLPVLPHEKLIFADSEHGMRSNDDASSKLIGFGNDVVGKDHIEDFDLDGIGSLLPGEDELLAGMMDDFDLSGLTGQVENLEDCDLFGSGGGMELDFDTTQSLSVALAKASINDAYLGNGLNGTVEYNIQNGARTVTGEHPYGEHPFGEHPSRTLFVRNINSNVEDSELQTLFEQYGDIRTLYTGSKHRGFVMISYYDIRAARTAMRTLQNKPLRRRKLDIHFSIPKDNPSEKDINQGTLVVFNLDPSVSNDDLRQIFGAYGEVKEIRETPHKRHHKFIEYYDVRAAEAALRALNRSDIAGKRIKLEPSRPGGARRNLMQHLSQELEHDETRSYGHPVGSPLNSSPPGAWNNHVGSPILNSPPGPWAHTSSPSDNSSLRAFNQPPNFMASSPRVSNSLPGLASILPPPRMPSTVKISPIGREHSRVNDGDRAFSNSSISGVPFQPIRPFVEHSNGITPNMNSSPVTSFAPTSGVSDFGTLTGNQFLWGSPNPYPEHTQSSAWPTSSMGHSFISNGQGKGFPYPSHGAFIPSSQHHVGSAPSGMPFERRFGSFPESPELPFMSPVGIGSMGSIGRNEGRLPMGMGVRGPMNPDLSDNGSPIYRMISSQRFGSVYHGSPSFGGPGSIGNEGLIERSRSRRVDNNGLDSKKQYQLDLEKIVGGEDMRTTLMIKNIPNKYTSKMLLAAIDENHKGTYDFVYLPIDFKNKCNVGYAFINMVSPSHIIPFYEAFNGKKWEKFNSEKVASLAYARIQGLDALIAHFQNSSLMNEDKRCRPIIFHSDGSAAVDQETFLPNGTFCDYHHDGASHISHGSPMIGPDEKAGNHGHGSGYAAG